MSRIGKYKWNPATKAEIRNRALNLAYLGSGSAIRAALINEYGYTPNLPAPAYCQQIADDRKASFTQFRKRCDRGVAL